MSMLGLLKSGSPRPVVIVMKKSSPPTKIRKVFHTNDDHKKK